MWTAFLLHFVGFICAELSWYSFWGWWVHSGLFRVWQFDQSYFNTFWATSNDFILFQSYLFVVLYGKASFKQGLSYINNWYSIVCHVFLLHFNHALNWNRNAWPDIFAVFSRDGKPNCCCEKLAIKEIIRLVCAVTAYFNYVIFNKCWKNKL